MRLPNLGPRALKSGFTRFTMDTSVFSPSRTTSMALTLTSPLMRFAIVSMRLAICSLSTGTSTRRKG